VQISNRDFEIEGVCGLTLTVRMINREYVLNFSSRVIFHVVSERLCCFGMFFGKIKGK